MSAARWSGYHRSAHDSSGVRKVGNHCRVSYHSDGPRHQCPGATCVQEQMKITAVEPFHISVPYDFGNTAQNAAAVQWPTMETLFVKVTTDDGIIGWGEGFG